MEAQRITQNLLYLRNIAPAVGCKAVPAIGCKKPLLFKKPGRKT